MLSKFADLADEALTNSFKNVERKIFFREFLSSFKNNMTRYSCEGRKKKLNYKNGMMSNRYV